MFTVYVLKSLSSGRFYTGQTDNFERRLSEHNSGRGGHFTHLNKPFVLVYKEEFETRPEAMKREKELKTSRGRNFVKLLVGQSVS